MFLWRKIMGAAELLCCLQEVLRKWLIAMFVWYLLGSGMWQGLIYMFAAFEIGVNRSWITESKVSSL